MSVLADLSRLRPNGYSLPVSRFKTRGGGMANEHIIYNGMQVIREWPARVAAAQEERAYEIAGVWFLRIRYGHEQRYPVPAAPCHDCAVLRGQFHVPGCDVEECPRCRLQAIGCDCTEPTQPAPQAGSES